VARERIEKNGWKNVVAVEGDATAWTPDEGVGCADLVTFTYSLSMIPDWFAAIEHANSLLSVRGLITIVDFYVSRKYPANGMVRHGWATRTLWPAWFANDNVNLSMDILPFLRNKFHQDVLHERMGSAPIVSFLKFPYYTFVGSKKPAKP
jgi:S-adenosylmethionine-diacylgycerolhomoserine-N-methlytransferase